jgi:hypothetical protein
MLPRPKRIFFPLLVTLNFLLGPSSGFTKDLNIQSQQISSGKIVNYVRIDLVDFDVRVLTPLVLLRDTPSSASNPERMPQGLFLSDYLVRYGAVLVMSGGYIDSYSPPTSLGFVKSNSTLVTPPHNSWLTNGVFCSDAGRATIQLVDPEANRPNFRDCLQAGPLLVSAGQVLSQSNPNANYVKLAQSVQEQGFVCLDANMRVLMGVTDKINLATLVGFLTLPEIGCKEALRLTGLDTAGLRDRNNHLAGHDGYLFPNAIGVIPKK